MGVNVGNVAELIRGKTVMLNQVACYQTKVKKRGVNIVVSRQIYLNLNFCKNYPFKLTISLKLNANNK